MPASSDPFDDFEDDDFDDEFDDDFEEEWDDKPEDDGFGKEFQDTDEEKFDVNAVDIDDDLDKDIPIVIEEDEVEDGDSFSDDADFDE
jgi:hypothetical protein